MASVIATVSGAFVPRAESAAAGTTGTVCEPGVKVMVVGLPRVVKENVIGSPTVALVTGFRTCSVPAYVPTSLAATPIRPAVVAGKVGTPIAAGLVAVASP